MENRSPHKRITLRLTQEVEKLLLDAVEISGRSMNAEINTQLLEALKSSGNNTNNELAELIREVLRKELPLFLSLGTPKQSENK